MTAQPHPKENLYFAMKVFFSLLGLYLAGWLIATAFSVADASLGITFVTLLVYVVLIVFYFWFVSVLMIGHLRGSGIEINENQFPEVHAMVTEIAAAWGLKKLPQVFLVQSGGVLNAYATRFAGRNYVALYSEVFSVIETEPAVLKFILAHELAHIQRNHLRKRAWTFLSFYVPFLGSAYSRACEYTCDAYAAEATTSSEDAGQAARQGLLLLAAGKDLYRKVNVEQYLASFQRNNSFTVRLAEVLSSHPHLPHRLAALARQ